jgi:hypothetical protein
MARALQVGAGTRQVGLVAEYQAKAIQMLALAI